jgi:putative ABC transport system permease protein
MNGKKLVDLLSTIWTGLSTHKLRSFLTILGVVIGVAAVIALMSIGQGTQASILSRLEGLGSNLLFISPGQSSVPGGQFVVRQGAGSATTLTLEDAQAIAQEVPNLAAVAPANQSFLQLVYGSQNTRSQVIGCTLDYEVAYGLVVPDGSFFTQDQYDSGQRVAVLGPNVASTLFGTDEPVGQVIRMGNSVATVVGVLASKGQSFGSTDNAILIPLTTMQQMVANSLTSTGQHRVSSIVLSATDKKYVDTVNADITALLQQRHGIDPNDPTQTNDFTITTQQDLLNTVTQATNSITLLLGAIAAISLLVGGIGVMNIMLVSVLERTREIGIRKALGAKERDIWVQFLIEAATLTLSGGIAGVIIGWVLAYLVARSGTIPALVTPNIVILAVSVSAGIGLFFGFYPAWNASRLNPIEALRSE